MAVPARHIRRAETGHGFRFHDEILEDLVQRGAHVDVAVGKGRTVVQDKSSGPRARLLDLLVKPRLLPLLQISGSRVVSPAFIGKSVFGRLSVSL